MIEQLWRQLTADGFVVKAARRRAATAGMIRRGQEEFEQVQRDAGLPMESVESSAVRSLGTGAAITEFATSGIGIPLEFAAHVAALGGLATLIVSAFDAIVDSGAVPPPISLGALRQPEAGHGTLKRRILARLVELYYERLGLLPNRHMEVRAAIDRAIDRMYRAELQSIAGSAALRTVWWRKNVLPFAVMAGPGWLTIHHWNSQRFQNHMRWVCRLGEFLGWVDDCADLGQDGASGHINRVHRALETTSKAELAGRIARQGRRILTEWDLANRSCPVRDTLAVIVWSWIDSKTSPPAE